MNRTLEETARALFQSWFVDFDPVRAKAEGRETGLPAEIDALFPDRLVESELGEIPEGWEASTLEQLCFLTIGGDWGTDDPIDGSQEAFCLRGVDLEHLRQEGDALPPKRYIKLASLAKRHIESTDVLVAGSGAGPTGRSLWFAPSLSDMFALPITYSNFCKRLRCKSTPHAVYVDRVLNSMRESGEIWEYVNGTSVPNLDTTALLSTKVIVSPSQDVLDHFHKYIVPISDLLYSKQNYTLAALRDTLLPKLISGELRVPEAEELIEETA